MALIKEWFRVIQNGKFIGIATDQDFARVSPISGRPLICNVIDGQYIVVNDKYYRDNWMLPLTPDASVEYEDAIVESIKEKEYDILLKGMPVEEPVDTDVEDVEKDILKRSLAESDELMLDFERENKLIELSAKCTEEIENGFSLVLSDGASHHFSLTMEDQINLFAMEMAIELGKEPIYHADGELTQYYGEEDARAIIAGAKQWRLYNTTRYNSLKNWVENIDDLEEIDAVKYDSDIPEEYCTDVLKDLTDNF